MTITITRNTDRDGKPLSGTTNALRAEAAGLPNAGCGRTWGEAFESLVRANPTAFNITAIVTRDPLAANAETTWDAKRAEQMIQGYQG